MHLKRYAAERMLPTPVKGKKFVTRPAPGPHPLRRALPLLLVVRDLLEHAETAKEARKIIAQGKISVDGRPVRNRKWPVGLMDVVEIPEMGEIYRAMPLYRKGTRLVRISEEEKSIKLGKIARKHLVRGGSLQITLHDGRNMRFPPEETPLPFKTGNTVKITIPQQQLLEHLQMEEGVYGLIYDGPKQGLHGRVVKLIHSVPRKRSLATLQTEIGEVTTILNYVFAVGEEEPWVKLQ